MNWFITHMVAPKEKALPCQDCHTRAETGRLNDIRDIYLPGRDYNYWVDLLGWLAVAGSIGGGLTHGAVRIFSRRSK